MRTTIHVCICVYITLIVHPFSRSAVGDRANLRAGQIDAARRARLRHHQSSFPADEDFLGAYYCLH